MNKKLTLRFIGILTLIITLSACIMYMNVNSFSKDLNFSNPRLENTDIQVSNNVSFANMEYMGKLNITNAYGGDSAYHPKLISFENKWNGYKYWLCFTPYPEGDDSKENPHVVVSNDMINFTEIEGFKNPLEDKPNDYVKTKIYYSDCNLVYNEDKNELECWWRYCNLIEDIAIIYRKTTKDGVHWSDKQVVVTTKKSEEDHISPAVIYDDGIYKMWYVSKPYTVYYKESSDLITWSKSRKINIEYENDDLQSWHLDVIESKGKYMMVMSAFLRGHNRRTMDLYYSESSDNENWSIARTILKPSKENNSWDNGGIYRSCLLEEKDNYYICYSASSKQKTEGIGLIKFNILREERI